MTILRASVLTVYLLLTISVCFGQDDMPVRQTIINNGIGLGGAIAVAISWSRNTSILWAIIHGILGWLYVIYAFFTKSHNKS